MTDAIVRSLVLVSLLTGTFQAQAVTMSANIPQNPVANQTAKGLRAEVSVNLTRVPVKEIIQSVAQQAGLKVTFGDAVARDNSLITLRQTRVSAEEALQQALKGTKFSYTILPGGNLLFDVRQSQSGKAQGAITGRVVDAKSGKGIAGANVSVDSDNRGSITSEAGAYRLPGIRVGTHAVTVRFVGYAKQTRSVTVGEGATVTADFKLESSANVLDQVIVTGTVAQTELKAVPNAITVITAKQIEERGITRIDHLFRGDIPGLFSVNKGSSALLDDVSMFSRGATALSPISSGVDQVLQNTNAIKTYIDGVEMASSQYLSQIDPSSIERIEILTGPQASTIYGANAINGVMQIFTKRGSVARPQINIALTSGVLQSNYSSHLAPEHLADARMSGIEGRLSYNAGGSWNYVGPWTPSKQTQRLSASGGGRTDLGKVTVDFSARQGLTKNRQYGSTRQGDTRRRVAGTFSYAAGDAIPKPQTQSLSGRTLGASLSYRPFSWWSSEVGLGSDAAATESMTTTRAYQTRTDTSLSMSLSNTTRTSQRYSTTLQLPLASFAGLSLTVGGDHWRTKGLITDIQTSSLTGSLTNAFIVRPKPDKNSGVYIQGQVGISDALFLTYGVRTDWNPNFGDDAQVRPGRYGVSYAREFGPVSAKLRGSYGRSIRPPAAGLKLGSAESNTDLLAQFGPYDWQLANPDLGPEHQQGGEGGVELYLGSRMSLVVTRFNQTVDNLISNLYRVDSVASLTSNINTNICSSNAIGGITLDASGRCYIYQFQSLNVGSIRNQGWETQGSVNLGPLTTRGTYSWTKSRVLGITHRYKALLSGSRYERGRPFDYIPEHTWALGFSYSRSASTALLSLNGVGAQYKQADGVYMASVTGRITASRPRMGLDDSFYRPQGPGYAVADLNVTHRFSPRVDAIIQVNNLGNYYQTDYSAQYSSLGRQSRVGVRLRMQ